MEQPPNDSLSLADYIGYAVGALGAAASAVAGWLWTIWNADRQRLATMESCTKTIESQLETVADDVENMSDRQSAIESQFETHSLVLAEIRTDVKWICESMSHGPAKPKRTN